MTKIKTYVFMAVLLAVLALTAVCIYHYSFHAADITSEATLV